MNETHKIVLIDRITLVKTAVEAMQATRVKFHHDVQLEADVIRDKCVVECIPNSKADDDEVEDLLLWYGYSLAAYMWEPSHHLSQPFIRSYLIRQQRAEDRCY